MNDATFRELISGTRRGAGAGLIRGGLSGLSWCYGGAVRLRNRAYDVGLKPAQRAAVPVVSVGNITTGGTGKTPFVAWLANRFTQQGLRVVLLSRGYRALDDQANDEKRVLDQLCPGVPHLQHPDRAALAARAINEHRAQVLILDDGFQHRRLARDLDIVLIDCLNPWGYGRLLPRGLLREPLAGLRRAGVVVLTRADQCPPEAKAQIRQAIARTGAAAPIVEIAYPPEQLLNTAGETAGLDTLARRPVLGFCGLGNPDGFRHLLTELGSELTQFVAYPDHHHYTSADVDSLARQAAESNVAAVVTTQKDLVKLTATQLADRPLWAIQIGTRILKGGSELEQRLDTMTGAVHGERGASAP